MEEDRETNENPEIISGEERQLSRREFFARLGKWSKIAIGVALAGSALTASDNREAEAYSAAWVNRGGGGWVNRYGGGGGWVNRYGGDGAWINHCGGSAGWVNRAGVSGTCSNRGGGGGWVNRW
jgi:hypothetical protein